jgi:hypothetical protein
MQTGIRYQTNGKTLNGLCVYRFNFIPGHANHRVGQQRIGRWNDAKIARIARNGKPEMDFLLIKLR